MTLKTSTSNDQEPYLLGLWDTFYTHEECAQILRPLTYSQTDVFLVCLSTVSPASIETLKRKVIKPDNLVGPPQPDYQAPGWIPEINHHCPNTPFLLVGTKIDLRIDRMIIDKLADTKQKPLSVEMGEELAMELGAVKYVECSALSQKGVKNVFEEAILAALEFPNNIKQRRCCLL